MIRRPVRNYRFALVSIVLLSLVGLMSAVHAAGPPDTPFLRIETGMHTAPISRIDVDAAERYLVTASFDKTARVWDLADGKLLRILRPPLGSGNEGRLFAVAISPDGKTVAVGGWTGYEWNTKYSIYFFDRDSGKLTRRVDGLPNVINHLAYSPDGRYLAVALGRDNGIRVYRTSDLAEVGRDTDYGGGSYWVEFDRQGRLVSTSEDGYLRLYGADFKLIAKRSAPGGKDPFSARFSPSGDKVAVGFDDSTAVNVLSGEDLSFLYAPATQGVDNGDLSKVAWSQDGQTLYAGGRYNQSGGDINSILTWNQAGRGTVTQWPASTTTIMDLRALKNGRLAFGAQDPAIGVFDAKGRKVWALLPFISDYRYNQERLLVSQDGSRIQFSFDVLNAQGERNKRPARLDVSKREFTLPVAEAETKKSKLSPPRTTAPGLEITGWEDTTEPRLNGQALPLNSYETARSLAIAPDNQHFLLGTEWKLRLFDRQGRQQWEAPVPGIAWAVNISGDGRFAVAAFGDGTIRWYRLEDGKERLAFFAHADGKRWVMWTPEGFFAASKDGEQLIGYHLNQGADHEGQFVKVEQLYDLFYRPDLVEQSLTPEGEQAILAQVQRIGDVRQVLAGGLPPELKLLTPPEVHQTDRDFTLDVQINDRGGGIGKLVFRVNRVVVEPLEARPADKSIPGQRRFRLPAAPGKNDVSATAYNGKDTIESRAVETVVYVDEPREKPPSLYVLAIGVTNYRDQTLALKYAAADAQALAQMLQQRAQGLFQTIEVYPLLDRKVTLETVTQAFNQLAPKVQPSDVFVLYLAGHGEAIDGKYHFVLPETPYINENYLRKGSLDQDSLQTLLAKILTQKSVVILDTCYAGLFNLPARGGDSEKTAIEKLMKATGRAVLAATSDKKYALEGYDKHGVFTYALLQGLSGRADKEAGNNDGQISIDELANFTIDEVPHLTKKRWGYEQFPVFKFDGRPFPVGISR
ncbi:MAG: caspase family protein [Candidatus Competibacteraceae bacterium]